MPSVTLPNILLILMAVMSLILFILMGVDKKKAKKGAWRIPEKTLFLFAFFGGAIGGLAGMYTFRHKTKHWYFVVGFWLFALGHIALEIWLRTRG